MYEICKGQKILLLEHWEYLKKSSASNQFK